MNILKKSILASAVSMALAGSAHAGFVVFDTDGIAGGTQFNVASFSWNPGNLVMVDVAPPGNAPNPIQILAQARLGNLVDTNNQSQGVGATNFFTYQMSTYVDFNAGTGLYGTPSPAVATTFFDIFWNGSDIASDITGCGYGTAQSAFCATAPSKRIFHGTATVVDTDLALTSTVQPAGTSGTGNLLDRTNDANQVSRGVTTTHLTFALFNVEVNTITYDPTFFLSNITSLGTDITQSESGTAAPFLGAVANPSDEVVGRVTKRTSTDVVNFFGSDLTNDLTCAPTSTVPGSPVSGTTITPAAGPDPRVNACGIQLSNRASSGVEDTPILVPAPGTLALLGLGLAGIGAGVGRRRRRV